MSQVVFFQAGRATDRTVPQVSKESQRRTLKPARAEVDPALQVPLSAMGELIVLALDKAHLTEAEAATTMGISGSLFSRQLRNLDNQHISLQRLDNLSNAFWKEFVLLVAERRKFARLQQRLVFEGGEAVGW